MAGKTMHFATHFLVDARQESPSAAAWRRHASWKLINACDKFLLVLIYVQMANFAGCGREPDYG